MIPPIENPYLFGHEIVEAKLARLIKHNRLPHALLFCGIEGIGKASLAFRLARYLLARSDDATYLAAQQCNDDNNIMDMFAQAIDNEKTPNIAEKRGEYEAESLAVDMNSEIVSRMIAGSYGDLLYIAPLNEKSQHIEGKIKIEQIRKINEIMRHTSGNGNWRVVIIDDAETMTLQAANALLKILEEPPDKALFIIVTHNVGRLLPTIISRCQKFTLAPLDEQNVEHVFARQGIEIDDVVRQKLLQLAGGSPGLAIRMHNSDALTIYQQIISAMLSDDLSLQQEIAARMARSSAETWRSYQIILTQILYRLARYSRMPQEFVAITDDEVNSFEILLMRYPLAYWLDLWEKTAGLLGDIARLNLDKQQVILTILFAAAKA